MSTNKRCPDCGTELPPDAPDGVCPKCLLQAGLDDSLAAAVDAATLTDGWTPAVDVPTNSATEQDPDVGWQAPRIGTQVKYFGDYELLDEIARGGMGVVYRARQVRLNRTVALKMILAGQFAGQADVKRFQTEAESAAQLDHPGIVPIFEVGEHEGHHYFSMGFVAGDSLAARIAAGPLSVKEAAETARQIAAAIQYAHDKGVIHRDLKPANILIDGDGQPKVTDFGLARKVQSDSGLTATGQILGTPGYMSPEQAAGETAKIGPAADVYSLGAILYAVLTGRPPFQSANVTDTLLAVLEQEPVSPRQLNPGVDQDLETICLKCLEKNLSLRYRTAQDLADELGRYLNGEPIRARPVGRSKRLAKWIRRRPALSAAVALAMLATVTLLFAWVGFTFNLRVHRDFAMEQWKRGHAQLVASLIQEARAQRAAGNRQLSLEAISKVPRSHLDRIGEVRVPGSWSGLSDELQQLDRSGDAADLRRTLRREAIETLITPGLDLAHKIPFGEIRRIAISTDGRLLAVCGRFDSGGHGTLDKLTTDGDGSVFTRILDVETVAVWELESGLQIAQQQLGPFCNRPITISISSQACLEISEYEPLAAVRWNPTAFGVWKMGMDISVWEWKGGGDISVWDPTKDRTIGELHRQDGKSLALDLSSALMARGSPTSTLVCDAKSGETIGKVLDGRVMGFLPPDEAIVVGKFGRTLRRVNFKTGAVAAQTPKNFDPLLVGPAAKLAVLLKGKDSADRKAILWDMTENREVSTVGAVGRDQHFGPYALRFSPDSRRLAYNAARTSRVIHVWNRDLQGLEAVLPGCIHYRNSSVDTRNARFSPDGRLLAAYNRPEPGGLHIWDVTTGKKIADLPGCFGPVWSATGNWLATMSQESDEGSLGLNFHGNGCSVRVWRVTHPPGETNVGVPVQAVRFSPDGDRLIANNKLWRFEPARRPPFQKTELESPVDALVIDGRGTLLAVELPVNVLELQEETFRVRFPESQREPVRLGLFKEIPDIHKRHSRTASPVLQFKADRIDSDHSGRYLATFAQVWWREPSGGASTSGSGARESGLVVFDLQSPDTPLWNTVLPLPRDSRHQPGRSVKCLRIDPRGEVLATGDSQGLNLWDLTTGELLQSVVHKNVWESNEDLESGWHEKTGAEPPYRYTKRFSPQTVDFSPAGERIYSGCEDGRIYVTSREGQELGVLQGHDGTIRSIAVHPHRQLVASGGADRTVRLWDVSRLNQKKGFEVAAWTAHADQVTALLFDPEGRYLVSGAADGSLKVWDLRQLREGLKKLHLVWSEPAMAGAWRSDGTEHGSSWPVGEQTRQEMGTDRQTTE